MKTLFLGALLMTSIVAQAADQAKSTVSRTETAPSSQSQSVETPWKVWGLTADDWKEYQSIMAGPRGIWTPNVSPLTALGVHAESEADRLRYARLSAELDYERIRAEAHWQLTFDSVKTRVWGEKQSKEPTTLSLESLKSHQRVSLFTDAVCDARCRRVMALLRKSQVNVDVFFVGSTSRADIVEWAKQQQLPPEAVNKTRQYSLNHDRGLLKSLGHDDGNLPLVMLKSLSGIYEVVTL
ncbi:MAG: TIGR03759 family integrating conjugative element protein [Cellvibrionaceae bacterium]|nr:TIGR03759 family integrating conjugative element protein [Cellvibrionaceae bacterium]|tara:strand:+ start:7897 stop:8613 length:717 start_codon:yes stop_codon:yes gene_type:complete